MRTGIGYDIHRLIPSLKQTTLPLGGVDIPCYFSVEAHSDGDVLLHAIADGILGALALGDIGTWFSDKDPENRGRKSSEFIAKILRTVKEMNWRIVYVDSNIFLEEPKIAPHSDAIRGNIAELLSLELSSVSVKAKTMEGLGPIGEKRAIAAQAIVSLEENCE
jgi:2-C-methyl-D-erythritol 2,4-cyclodiphosphate synthase